MSIEDNNTDNDATPIEDVEIIGESKTVDAKAVIEDVKPPFWKRNFLALFLLVLLIISLSYGFIKNQMSTSTYQKMVEALEMRYDHDTKLLKEESAKKLVSTLALAVRSGMIANDMEQVNRYFLESLDNIDAQRILLINHNSGNVTLSTNKKDEGKKFEVLQLVKTKETMTLTNEEGAFLAASPIEGLNTQLGVLVIEMKFSE